MITLETAIHLRQAGLHWTPSLHDFFAIPERDLDERIFVISDMLATTDILQGLKVISFQGASEWALDSLVLNEAVWMPTESQLRIVMENLLDEIVVDGYELSIRQHNYLLSFFWESKPIMFQKNDVCELYATVVLFLLKKMNGKSQATI